MKLKNTIASVHSWTGTIMSILFVIWFASGLFMIFSGFPHSTSENRFNSLASLDSIKTKQLRIFSSDKKKNVYLEMFGDKLIYRIYKSRHRQEILDANSLKPISEFTTEQCMASAERYAHAKVDSYETLNEFDQWIPWSHYKVHFPILKCKMQGDSHQVLYVSSSTGEVIQDTDRQRRWMARFGAIPHYAYYKFLRLNTSVWMQVVMWLSGIGSLMCLSGIIVGLFRLKRKQGKKRVYTSVYKKFWWKWHHVFGLIFGLFSFTFVGSGLVSLSGIPQWVVKTENTTSFRKLWNKQIHSADLLQENQSQIRQFLNTKKDIRQVEFRNIAGANYLFLRSNKTEPAKMYALEDSLREVEAIYTKSGLEEQVQNFFPDLEYELSLQEKYDNYYQASGMGSRPLPVYKLSFANEDKDWLYIDTKSGAAVYELNRNSRVRRWVYRALHTFNLQALKEKEGLRKFLLIVASIGGLFLSVSGMVLGFKWIKRKLN